MTEVKREVVTDAEALARHAASFLVETVRAVAGEARVCLSGGSTPKRLFELLASPGFRDRVPWDRVHWFWGDERFVPQDHPESNYGMTRRAMLDHVPAPAANVHPIRTEGLSPAESAADYERLLKSRYGADRLDPARPLFDLTFLGVGDDGHTASLIPGADAALAERTRWTAVVEGLRPETRVTLTYPALDSARHVAFLAAGANKRDILRRIALGEDLPSAHVSPVGTLHWMLDRAAAGDA